ncbi:MAG: LON peptidase substrate-binding domain-containing protein [Aestuariivita sp.]|nr:LON peptidase substrate-binding domain-containing protein [Aestuariivita sp.]MCY4204024.1 LON peptidase substrate-binding domain-containing protein [Aestuariivita sp.]MCY4289757.1 LON peptidase substrate-binding domain-containing protein [Aestuariivita sp.]MCY4347635.1 LON peptidase substrate-binding domain-containing protein [Aestuariivita sp.]
MINAANLPQTLAVFPLPGALLLPRSRLPLHIFEPRYLQMFDDSLKTSTRLIGMVQPDAHAKADNALYSIGCAGKITQFSETEDGRYLITLTGVSRYRITQEVASFLPYRKCIVCWEHFDGDLGTADQDEYFDRAALIQLLEKYFSARGLSTDWETMKAADDELLINSLATLLDFDTEDRQALLEAPDLTARRKTLVTLIEFALHGGMKDERIQ